MRRTKNNPTRNVKIPGPAHDEANPSFLGDQLRLMPWASGISPRFCPSFSSSKPQLDSTFPIGERLEAND